MIRVAKLIDNTFHGHVLNNGNVVNVVVDCNDNYIISLRVLNWLLIEYPELTYEEIDFCPLIDEEI